MQRWGWSRGDNIWQDTMNWNADDEGAYGILELRRFTVARKTVVRQTVKYNDRLCFPITPESYPAQLWKASAGAERNIGRPWLSRQEFNLHSQQFYGSEISNAFSLKCFRFSQITTFSVFIMYRGSVYTPIPILIIVDTE